jgi:tripartite-type tricarboxylate transporter receptor subunit TctC
LPYLRSGKLRALAVAGAVRVSAMPDLPTLAQAGLEGIDATQWYALFAPAKTPLPVLSQVNRALADLLQSPDTVARLAGDGMQVGDASIDALRQWVLAERSKWQQVVRQLHWRSEVPSVD